MKKATIEDNGIYKNCQTSPVQEELMVKNIIVTVA